MNKLLLGGAALAAILAIAPAVAQTTAAPATALPQAQTQMRVMHMPMKAQTRDEVVAHVRDMFAKADANRDGFVTREEADAAHKLMASEWHDERTKRLADRGTQMPDRNARFDALDTNKDGQISRQEYVSAQPQIHERRMTAMNGGKGGKMRMHRMGMAMHGRMFDTADANKDGKVSLQEMQTLALQHFDSADANHDGTLTPEERRQMHLRMKAERQRPA